MSALYLCPLTISRRVGTCPSRKFSVTSYTADTDTERAGIKVRKYQKIYIYRYIYLYIYIDIYIDIVWIIDEDTFAACRVGVFTCASETLESCSKPFGSGQ